MASGNPHRRRTRLTRNGHLENGFTLMEVMVALSVVAIALMAIYRMHSQTLFMDARGRFDTVATLLMSQKLADIDTIELEGSFRRQWRFRRCPPRLRVANPNGGCLVRSAQRRRADTQADYHHHQPQRGSIRIETGYLQALV